MAEQETTKNSEETIKPAGSAFGRMCQKHPYLSTIAPLALAGALVAVYTIWTDQENFETFTSTDALVVTQVTEQARALNANGTIYLFDENGEYCLLPTIPRENNFRSGRDFTGEDSVIGTIAGTLRGETVVGEQLPENALELFQAQLDSPLVCD